MKKSHLLISVFAGIALLFSCQKQSSSNQTVVCDGSNPTYDSYVKSIVDNNCISCHGPGSNDGDFSTFTKLETIVNNGKFKSTVITFQSMPTSGPLSDTDLSKLQCWLDNGHPEN